MSFTSYSVVENVGNCKYPRAGASPTSNAASHGRNNGPAKTTEWRWLAAAMTSERRGRGRNKNWRRQSVVKFEKASFFDGQKNLNDGLPTPSKSALPANYNRHTLIIHHLLTHSVSLHCTIKNYFAIYQHSRAYAKISRASIIPISTYLSNWWHINIPHML